MKLATTSSWRSFAPQDYVFISGLSHYAKSNGAFTT
jgi:hypothetical protein